MWRPSITKQILYNAFENCKELIVFDTETTGLSTKNCDIIQISAIKYLIESGSMNEIGRLDQYINPGYCVPPKVTEINGITDEMLVDMPSVNEAFTEKIYPFFGDNACLAGYNVPFDIRFLTKVYEDNGHMLSPECVLDVLSMARDLVPKEESKAHKLSVIANLYGADSGLTFHNSMDDVIATARLLKVFMHEYKVRDEEAAVSGTSLLRVNVLRIGYWEGFRGMKRVYIHTNVGKFYYDILKKCWEKDKSNLLSLNEIDMEQLRVDTFKLAKASDENELSRYRG